MQKLKNFINGKWVNSESNETFHSINPADTCDIVAMVPHSTPKDVGGAAEAAKKAFPAWRDLPPPKRGEILFRAAELFKQNKDRLGSLVTREMGKVKKEGDGDVQEAIDIGFLMAGEGRRLHGETTPSELPNKSIRTIREPIGVFGCITPWNFPIAIPAWKIFAALICGNTVVFKPSQFTPTCAVEFVKIFELAGLPPGVLNLVLGTGEEVGNYIVKHPDIDGISFTGSTKVGKGIGQMCGGMLKKHSLEMGGKNVIIVMDDAKIDLAVDGCLWAAFGTTGQRCTACSRIVVHEKIYDKFMAAFINRTKKLKLGNGLDQATDVGPLVNANAVKKVEYYVEWGKKNDKARLVLGGKRATGKGLEHGYFYEPTIFEDVVPTMKIACEEIFGPVVSILKVKDFDHAIDVANNAVYGLSSAIFTTDIYKAEKAARLLGTGLVYINTATIGAEVQAPFGGNKNTGNGHREAGGLGGALETYTNMKVILIDYSGRIQKAQIAGEVMNNVTLSPYRIYDLSKGDIKKSHGSQAQADK